MLIAWTRFFYINVRNTRDFGSLRLPIATLHDPCTLPLRHLHSTNFLCKHAYYFQSHSLRWLSRAFSIWYENFLRFLFQCFLSCCVYTFTYLFDFISLDWLANRIHAQYTANKVQSVYKSIIHIAFIGYHSMLLVTSECLHCQLIQQQINLIT